MTENSNLKAQARAYAAQKGISYTQARREILNVADRLLDKAETMATAPVAEFVTRRVLTIQQSERQDGVLPYPFFVDENGFVDRQDFWRGKPFRLIGFIADPDVYEVLLDARAWFENPRSAIGMHPVFADRDSNFATYVGEVSTVRESTKKIPAPQTVMAQVSTTDGAFDFSVGVGHLMWRLNDSDFDGSPRHGRIVPESAERMLGWLLSDPSGQDIEVVHDMYSHVEEITDNDGEPNDDPDSSQLVQVTLDREGVSQWVAYRHNA